jgi:hypothetical protein
MIWGRLALVSHQFHTRISFILVTTHGEVSQLLIEVKPVLDLSLCRFHEALCGLRACPLQHCKARLAEGKVPIRDVWFWGVEVQRIVA